MSQTSNNTPGATDQQPAAPVFDLQKFEAATFSRRTAEVPVESPALQQFFNCPEGTTPRLLVQSLTGEELARSSEAAARNKNVAAVLSALAAGSADEKARAIRDTLELSQDQLPEDLARRIEQLAAGCVEPRLTVQLAAKLFRVAPVDCYKATNVITQLSGQGQQPGE